MPVWVHSLHVCVCVQLAATAADCEIPWHRKNHELRLETRQIGTQQHSSKISHGDSDDQDDGDESRATDDDDDAFEDEAR